MLYLHSIETFGTQDGPGIRLVVFLQGCNMSCVYCHNPDSQKLDKDQCKTITTTEIIEKLERQRPYMKKGGITFSGGEPTLQTQELIDTIKAIKKLNFHITLDTNGSIYNSTVNELYDLCDLILLDVKHINPGWHAKLTGITNLNVLKNAAYREQSGMPLWLRYVLVPGYTDQPEYLEEWGQHFKDYQHIEKVEILPYHTLGVHKYDALDIDYVLKDTPRPTQKQKEKAELIFKKYLKNVQVK